MQVFQLPHDRFSEERVAIGRVAFHPETGMITAQTGLFSKKRCFGANQYHRLSAGTEEVETTRAKGRNWNYPALSLDGRFVAKAVHWHSGKVVLGLGCLWTEEPERGFALANPGDSNAWLVFGPDGNLYAAVNRGSLHHHNISHVDLFRMKPEDAIDAFDDPGAEKIRPFESSNELILDNALEHLGKFNPGFEYHNPPTFSPDCELLAVWPVSGPALVIDLPRGEIKCEVPWQGRELAIRENYRLALDSAGERIALVVAGQILCQRMDGIGKAWRKKKPVGYVTDVAFHPNGQSLIAVDRAGEVHHIDSESGKVMQTLNWEMGLLLCVAISADGTTAAAGGQGGNLVVWDLDD